MNSHENYIQSMSFVQHKVTNTDLTHRQLTGVADSVEIQYVN